MDIIYKVASSVQEFECGKNLFREYAASLLIDLSFQGFTEELETVNLQYNKPKGALLLAYKGDLAIGCVGIRELDNEIAELKRMFVKTEYRGNKIGQTLLGLSLDIAKGFNYHKIRLDTLPDMTPALNLYRSFGFYEIPSYRFNPVSGAVYMEKDLLPD